MSDETKIESDNSKKTGSNSKLYKKLASIVSEKNVSETNLDRILYSHDLAPLPKEMSLMFKTVPDVVVKPRNVKDVSRIMKLATKENIPVTPRGGASWAFGGAVPAFGGIVLDMDGMQEILEINKEDLFVTVEPGVNWKSLYDKFLVKGLLVAAHPSSAPGASIGGWVNTGGVGIGSYKYGGIDSLIRSLEFVLPDGTIVSSGCKNIMSNSSGYDLPRLLVGSEGTLAVLTKITLKIFPAPEEIRPTAFVFPSLEKANDAINALTRSDITPYHIAFLDGPHFDLMRKLEKDAPKVGAVISVVYSGNTKIIDIEEKIADKIIKENGGVKQKKKFADHEWSERYFEARSRRLGPGFILGESFCPISKFGEMAKRSARVLKKLKMNGAVVGTVVDPNTALFMTYAIPNEHKLIKGMVSMALVKKLTDAAFKMGGRPAGFGMLFSGNLKKIQGKGVYLMDDLKSAIDPHYIMNPGKFIENSTRFGIPVPGFALNIGMDVMAIAKRLMLADKVGTKAKKSGKK